MNKYQDNIETPLYVKHKVEVLEEGVFVQRCIRCGKIINDYSQNQNPLTYISDGIQRLNKGFYEGDVYINNYDGIETKISEPAISLGLCSIPKNFIDCS